MQNQNDVTIQTGLVVSYFGQSIAIEDQQGTIIHCHLRRNQEIPLVGDIVHWQSNSDTTGTITSIVKRKNLLARGDGRGKIKPIAANVDIIFVVMAPPPIFSEYLVDRYLVASELLGIKAIVVMNKIDLLNDETLQQGQEVLEPYKKISYPVVMSSIYSKVGLTDIANHLRNSTGVLVGPSGVGKSSIINALGSEQDIRVGDVSPKGAGKHTTTASRLYHLIDGGNLIDSPGVREFNLWKVDKKEILAGFPEFTQHQNCKFRDCNHLAEPGCAIKQAVSDNNISKRRYESYQMFVKEMEKR